MAIRIARTLPPAAAPISLKDIFHGLVGIISGPKVVIKFTEEIKKYFSVTHCFLVSSGKASLVLILQALKKLSPDRDEVLVPAYTCYSVPSAIVRAGLKVRVCDIDPETLDFDYEQLEQHLLSPRLLCVVPTHLFGVSSDIKKVRTLIAERDIFIVEDAAQAMGAVKNGCKLGTLGDVGFFSLGRGKAITTVEGGIILTSSQKIGEAINQEVTSIEGYPLHHQLKLIIYAFVLKLLIHPNIFWLPKMLPFLGLGVTHFETHFPVRRLAGFQAGLADGWENKLTALRTHRNGTAKKFAQYIINAPRSVITSDLLRFPMYVSSVDRKHQILVKSGEQGLGLSDGYPDSIDTLKGQMGTSVEGHSGKAREIAARLITLPVHPYVTDADVDSIFSLLKEFGELSN